MHDSFQVKKGWNMGAVVVVVWCSVVVVAVVVVLVVGWKAVHDIPHHWLSSA